MAQCQPTPAPAGAPPDAPAPGLSRTRWLRWAPLVLLVVVVLGALAFGLHEKLSLSMLRDRRAWLQGIVRRHPVMSLEIYAAAYAVIIGFSIPGALVMSLGGGYLFGALLGAPAAILGETVGATFMFLACRWAFAADFADRVFKVGLARQLTEALEDSPFTGLLTLRLIPAMPFTLVNLAAGLVRIPLGTYIAATLIGIAPSTFIYAWVGQGLGVALTRNGVPRPSSLIRPEVYLPLIALAAMGAGAFWWRTRTRRRNPARGSAEARG